MYFWVISTLHKFKGSQPAYLSVAEISGPVYTLIVNIVSKLLLDLAYF